MPAESLSGHSFEASVNLIDIRLQSHQVAALITSAIVLESTLATHHHPCRSCIPPLPRLHAYILRFRVCPPTTTLQLLETGRIALFHVRLFNPNAANSQCRLLAAAHASNNSLPQMAMRTTRKKDTVACKRTNSERYNTCYKAWRLDEKLQSCV